MEERNRRSGSGGRAADGGRAGGAEIVWEEARDGGARLKGMSRWTGCGRAGTAEIAWEEGSRRGKPVKSSVANFSKKKKGLYF